MKLGVLDINDGSAPLHRVSEIYVNAEWTLNILSDVALLKLSQPVDLTEDIQTIELADLFDGEYLLPGERVQVTGWGAIDGDGQQAPETYRKRNCRYLTARSASRTMPKPAHLRRAGRRAQRMLRR